MDNATERLRIFQTKHSIATKGPLALMVQLTRMVREKPFPLLPEIFLTDSKGQVAGLGGPNLKKILEEHGITQILASEGGRTSRGNVGLMMKYVEFLNEWQKSELINFDMLEAYWVEQAREYFRNQPFILMADPSRTIGASLDELFEQAKKRQKENSGTRYLGMVLQYLVAAKLSLVLPPDRLKIYGASVADSRTDRNGDFEISSSILHCTTAPNEPLIDKCKANIRAGYSPVIITIFDRVRTALDLAADSELNGRIEIWDVQQFLSANVHEHSMFDGADKNAKLARIIEKYNQIVVEVETDPSLRIEFEAS